MKYKNCLKKIIASPIENAGLFGDLPPEVLGLILAYIPGEIHTLRLVCRHFNELISRAEDNRVWTQLLEVPLPDMKAKDLAQAKKGYIEFHFEPVKKEIARIMGARGHHMGTELGELFRNQSFLRMPGIMLRGILDLELESSDKELVLTTFFAAYKYRIRREEEVLQIMAAILDSKLESRLIACSLSAFFETFIDKISNKQALPIVTTILDSKIDLGDQYVLLEMLLNLMLKKGKIPAEQIPAIKRALKQSNLNSGVKRISIDIDWGVLLRKTLLLGIGTGREESSFEIRLPRSKFNRKNYLLGLFAHVKI